MRDFRGKKIIKVISILLLAVFSFQQVAWAFHEDLRDQPDVGDYLVAAATGYLKVAMVNPAWSILDTLIITYGIPYVAKKAVDATGIKNKWVKLGLEVGVSVFLSSAYESFRIDERSIGEKADEVTEKAEKAYEETYKDAYAQAYQNELARNLSEGVSRNLAEETARIAAEQAATKAAQEAATRVAEEALKELEKKIADETASKLEEKLGQAQAEEVGKEVAASASQDIGAQVRAKIAEFTPEMIKRGFWASIARGAKNLWNGTIQFFRDVGKGLKRFYEYSWKERWITIRDGVWNWIKKTYHNFFLKSRSQFYAPPWQRASQEAVKAMTFVAAKYGAYEAYRYLIYGKKDLDTQDEVLLDFLSSFTGMPVSFYLGQAIEEYTGITKEGLRFNKEKVNKEIDELFKKENLTPQEERRLEYLLTPEATLQKNALEKIMQSERREFRNKFMIASVSEAIETTAIMLDPDLQDLGIVLSAGTSALLDRTLNKENYEARKAGLEADKALLESQQKALDSDENLDNETKSARKRAFSALIKYKQSQIDQLDVTYFEAAGQGAIRGAISVAIKEGVDAVTKGSNYISPASLAFVTAGLGAFTQAFFVKDAYLFVLSKDKQVLQVQGLEDNKDATKDIMVPSTGWQRLSLANNLILANNINIFTDFLTMGRGEAGVTYDEKNNPYWGITLRPMDIFYYRRLAGAIETMNEDGLGLAMMDQFVSSAHYQAAANIYDIISGNIQRPYVLILGKPGYRYYKGVWPVDLNIKQNLSQQTQSMLDANPENQYLQKTGERIQQAMADDHMDLSPYLDASLDDPRIWKEVGQGISEVTSPLTNIEKVRGEIAQERDKLSGVDRVVADTYLAALDKGINTYKKNRSASAGSLLGLGGGRWYILDRSLSAADLNQPEMENQKEILRQQYANREGLKPSQVRFAGEEPTGIGGVVISGYDRFYDLFGGRQDVFHAHAVPVEGAPRLMAAPQPSIQQVNLNLQCIAYFNFDRYDIIPEAMPTLGEVVTFLKSNPEAALEIRPIEGFTDRYGTEEYNFLLGERRANAIVAFLVANGISKDRFQVISHGETKAVGVLEDPSTRAKDRRVELNIWTKTTQTLEAPSSGAMPSASIEETQVLETPISLRFEEYTVKPGDNLWKIAKQYYPASKGAACDRIARYNISLDKSFNPYRLQVGQIIHIPIE